MTFVKPKNRNFGDYGNSNGWQEFLYALLLFRKGINPTPEESRFVSQTSLSIKAELEVWRCRPVDDYHAAHRFSFRRSIGEQKYQIDKGDTSLLFVSFEGLLASGNLTVEVRPSRGLDDGLEIVSTWGGNFESDENLLLHHPYLRIVVAEGTGQKGILFPREEQYRVLKYSQALVDPEFDLPQPDQYSSMSLNEFIASSYRRSN